MNLVYCVKEAVFMNVKIVIPLISLNSATAGYNEMLASELAAICNKNQVDFSLHYNFVDTFADIYLFPVQWRHDIFSDHFKKTVKECRKLGGITVACGLTASVEYQYILNNYPIDFVILGEADFVFDNILKQCASCNDYGKLKEQLCSVKGIAYRDRDSIITKFSNKQPPLDSLPYPKYEYLGNKQIQYPVCVMSTSRSCHGKCSFCAANLFRACSPDNTYRAKSPKRVADEVEYVIKSYNYRVFSFCDDNFFVDGSTIAKQRAINIANEIIKRKLRLRFTIECRADDVDKEIFILLKKAGLYKVFIGIETGAQSVLDRYHKGVTVEQNHKALQILRDVNIKCQPGYILFDPRTTKSELWQTVHFFEQYSDVWFSYKDGYDEKKLFFTRNAPILNCFWPDKDDDFYNRICYDGLDLEYYDTEAKCLFEIFLKVYRDPNLYPECNAMERHLYCLRHALEEYENVNNKTEC